MDGAVELADFIADLRGELERAIWLGENKPLTFELGTIELELAVVAERENKPNGKIKLWVLEAGAETRRRSMTTQTVRLKLEPQLRDRPGQKVHVHGGELPGER
jgi:hypothetical protein